MRYVSGLDSVSFQLNYRADLHFLLHCFPQKKLFSSFSFFPFSPSSPRIKESGRRALGTKLFPLPRRKSSWTSNPCTFVEQPGPRRRFGVEFSGMRLRTSWGCRERPSRAGRVAEPSAATSPKDVGAGPARGLQGAHRPAAAGPLRARAPCSRKGRPTPKPPLLGSATLGPPRASWDRGGGLGPLSPRVSGTRSGRPRPLLPQTAEKPGA